MFAQNGNGFKLAPMIGKILAQTAPDLPCDVDPTPYRFGRFEGGQFLAGSYGTGSIS